MKRSSILGFPRAARTSFAVDASRSLVRTSLRPVASLTPTAGEAYRNVCVSMFECARARTF